MAKQLDKKWIGDNQVDGEKIQLEYGQSIKAKNSSGIEEDLIKVGPAGEILVGASNEEVSKKSELDQEILDRASGDASTLVSANSYTDGEVQAEEIRALAAEGVLQDNIDAVQGEVDAEEIRALAAEGVLQTNIDNEAQARITGDENLQTFHISPLESYTGNLGPGPLFAPQSNYLPDAGSITEASTNLTQAVKALDAYGLAIGADLDTEITDRTDADAALQSQIDAITGGGSGSLSAVQAELDATQAGAGLNVDGQYSADNTSTYITGATSLKEADSLLDSALSNVESELNATQLGAGLHTDGTYLPDMASNYISTATNLSAADSQLDAALKIVDDNLDATGQYLGNKLPNGSFSNFFASSGDANAPAAQSQNITAAVNAINNYAYDTKLDLDGVESRVTVAEADIVALEGRMDTAESDIIAVEGRLDVAEADIVALEGRMTTAEADIVSLEGRMGTAEADIVALEAADLTFLKLDGSRPMEANLNMMNGLNHYRIVGLGDPVDARDAVNKQYVDAISEGLHVHAPAKVLINAPISGVVTYDNGSSGVGATLTLGTAINSVDSYSLQNGDRIIVNGQVNQAHNGIYVWATGGTVLTRASDFDSTIEAAGGDFIFVQEGSLFGSTGWVMTKTTTSIGTSPILFLQFSGAGTYSAGDALSLTGGEFNTLYDNVTVGVNGSNQLFLKDSSVSTPKLVDGSVTKEKIAADVAGNGLGQNANGSLEVKVDGASLEIASDIVQVKDDGITKEKIASDVAGTGLQQNVNGSLEIKLDGSSLSVSASGLKSNIVSKKESYAVSSNLTSGAFFDLAFVAEVDSVIAWVDRVAIHEGASHDFSVSYTGGVGGVTRIYFINALVTPGQQQLSNGDTVFFKYERKAS